MVNVAHASLTGAELHEPKGVSTASTGQVYVANGSGSGAWTSIDATAFTGMVADFATPLAPSGWLELDGSTISSTTYANLYAVMTIQQNGTRNGTAVITSLSSTTNMRAGYYVFGTGITSGTTILSVDSSTQITLSAAASGSGTNTVIVSPWLLNTGTIKLPDVATNGRFRRSRTASTAVGQTQADQNQAHTHSVSGNTGNAGSHTHTITITDPGHSHTTTAANALASASGSTNGSISGGNGGVGVTSPSTSSNTTGITSSANTVSDHNHSISLTSASSGGTEARPLTMVFITCVKT